MVFEVVVESFFFFFFFFFLFIRGTCDRGFSLGGTGRIEAIEKSRKIR